MNWAVFEWLVCLLHHLQKKNVSCSSERFSLPHRIHRLVVWRNWIGFSVFVSLAHTHREWAAERAILMSFCVSFFFFASIFRLNESVCMSMLVCVWACNALCLDGSLILARLSPAPRVLAWVTQNKKFYGTVCSVCVVLFSALCVLCVANQGSLAC